MKKRSLSLFFCLVYVIPVQGTIDLGLSAFMRNQLEEAKENNADAAILVIDTPGGRVDAALDILSHLREAKPVVTVAFVKGSAWSAGALIALGCRKIIMAPGTSIGSAEPRILGAGEEAIDEKTVSALRAQFRAAAEENGHSPEIAEAMVDKDIVLDIVMVNGEKKVLAPEEIQRLREEYGDENVVVEKSLTKAGKLLNLSFQEAYDLGVAEAICSDLEEVREHLNLAGARVVEKQMTWSQVLVRFLTHPFVSLLLLAGGGLGIYLELKMPGIGAPTVVAIVCFALFFFGHYLADLANWTELLLFAVGVGLLLVEIFVLPGFGFAGAAGIILIFGGIFLAFIKNPVPTPGNLNLFERQQVVTACYVLGGAVVLVLALVLAAAKYLPEWLPRFRFSRGMILTAEEKVEEGYVFSRGVKGIQEGSEGVADSSLRPAGRAAFGEDVIDVVTEGDYIEAGEKVKVVRIEGSKVVVGKAENRGAVS